MKYYHIRKPPPEDLGSSYWNSAIDFLDDAIVPETSITFPTPKWGYWNGDVKNLYYIRAPFITTVQWTVTKPEDTSEYPVWLPDMDYLDGRTLEDVPPIDEKSLTFPIEENYIISVNWLSWNGRKFPTSQFTSLLDEIPPSAGVVPVEVEPPKGKYHCGWCRQTKEQCAKLKSCTHCLCWIHCTTCGHEKKIHCDSSCECCACQAIHFGSTDGYLDRFKPLFGHPKWSDAIRHTLGDPDITPRVASMYVAIHYDLDCATRIIDTLANQMFYYILYSAVGEARHLSLEAISGAVTHEFGVSLRSYGRSSHYDVLWMYSHKIAQRFGPAFVLNALLEIFSLRWRRGYGGPKWRAMVQIAYDYYTLKISKLTFVDTVIDLVHNGGWALNKYYTNTHWCPRKKSVTLKTVLDTKFQDASKLVDMLEPQCLDKEIEEWITYQANLKQYGLPSVTLG